MPPVTTTNSVYVSDTCVYPGPAGALTIPDSCVIPVGASTCVVNATWNIENTNDAYLFDANPFGNGILYGQGRGHIPGKIPSGYLLNGFTDPPVNVAFPQTVFNLKNGDDSVLSSKTVTASCAVGST